MGVISVMIILGQINLKRGVKIHQMLQIDKQFIVDENNNRIAVQMDIKTFEKIEELLENYVLVELMKKNNANDNLNLEKSNIYYKRLKKAD